MEGKSVSGAPEWVLLLIVPVLAWSAMFLLAWALSALIHAYHYLAGTMEEVVRPDTALAELKSARRTSST